MKTALALAAGALFGAAVAKGAIEVTRINADHCCGFGAGCALDIEGTWGPLSPFVDESPPLTLKHWSGALRGSMLSIGGVDLYILEVNATTFCSPPVLEWGGAIGLTTGGTVGSIRGSVLRWPVKPFEYIEYIFTARFDPPSDPILVHWTLKAVNGHSALHVSGNGETIPDGDDTPRTEDNTDFGTFHGEPPDDLARSRNFILRNDGTSILKLEYLSVPEGFVVTSGFVEPELALAPGASREITVKFAPDLEFYPPGEPPGELSGDLWFYVSAPNLHLCRYEFRVKGVELGPESPGRSQIRPSSERRPRPEGNQGVAAPRASTSEAK